MWPRVAAYPDLSRRHRFLISVDARVSKSGAGLPGVLYKESSWQIRDMPNPGMSCTPRLRRDPPLPYELTPHRLAANPAGVEDE